MKDKNQCTGKIIKMNLPVAYGKMNAEGDLIMANRRWLKLFDTEEPMLPQHQPHGQLTKEYIRGYMDEALRLGESNFEIYANTPNKKFTCAAVTLQSEADGTFSACAYDISHYKTVIGGAIKAKAVMESEKKALDLARRFLDAAPIFIETWDNEMNLTGANQAAVKMFGLRDTDHYLEVYEELHPEFQPCGMKTAEKIPLIIEDVMKNGYTEGEWMHIDLAGNPVPVQSCYVRFDVGNDEHYIVGYSQDLRPIRAAMADLESALKMTQDLIDSAPLFIEIWDENLEIIECNDVAAKMFGVPAEGIHTRIMTDLSPEFQPCGTPSAEFCRKHVALAFEEGRTHVEYMHIDFEGKPFPVDVTYVRMRRGDKNVVVGYNVDLRPTKAASELTQMYLDAAPFFIEIWDSELNLISCNEAAVKMFGLSGTHEYVKIFDELSPELQPCGTPSDKKIREIVGKALKEGYYRSEWTHIGIDGRPFPVDVSYVKLKSGDEDIVVGYNQDLRPLRIAMDKLRASEERSKILLDASPTPSIIFDESINAVDSNFAALTLFAKEPDRSPITTYPHYPDLEMCTYEQCVQFHSCGRDVCPLRSYLLSNYQDIFVEHGDDDTVGAELGMHCFEVVQYGTKKFEQVLKTLYGEPIPCEITIVSVNYNDSQGFAFYLRDLREEKLRAMAEDANRAKSSFLSTISHEIRTPLNAILGITEIRLMDKDVDQKIRDDLMKIYASSDVLLKIINDILDLSKIEAGKLSILERKYEIASLIGDTIQLNIMRLDSKPTEFSLNIDENVPFYVLGDELRMKQILSNLLSNAFKYTEKGYVNLEIRTVDMPDSDDKLMLEMKVTDTGVGLTKQQIENIYEEFSRFHESESSPEGTGLGMSITKKLVSLMGGKLTVESEAGKGSVFTVLIPQGKILDSMPLGKDMVENLQQFRMVGTQRDITDIVREPMPYGKILVVDDVEINIYVVMGLLLPYELQVDDASNGLEAIEKIENGNEYDIIFMDHMMPEMDGIEATKIIRKLGYQKPIVALTANAVAGQAEMFLQNGFDDFISKPIDVRSMNLVLNKLIRDRRHSNE